MLALRLTRGARPAVHLRRLLVTAASAGTGFLLLSALGYAMSHPDSPAASLLRLAWCAPPLAATVHLAVATARTDPGTRPRPGLAAIGLGPVRLMAVAAAATALSCTLGSLLALLCFLHLRGDLTGMPFDGAAAEFLAADSPLPVPAALTLLTLVPAIASAVVAFMLRPKELGAAGTRGAGRAYGRFGAYGTPARREPFGAYGRFGGHLMRGRRGGTAAHKAAEGGEGPAGQAAVRRAERPERDHAAPSAGSRAAGATPGPEKETEAPADPATTATATATATDLDHALRPAPRKPPAGLPWGIAVLAAGLAVEAHAGRATSGTLTLSAVLPTGPSGVLAGWVLTALGLALAAPGLTHLCGRLLQAVRPGALRLLAGRVLMEEATRIGRPLGVVCAVTCAAYAMAPLSATAAAPPFGPLTALGGAVVTGCTLATLLTTAVEAKQARADTTAALLRLGAPAAMLRSAAALRAGALLALFGPLTLIVAELAALPLAR
ncbi:hypothetical protein [Streptomyces viridochromogenes]|uniref:Uncharacterized protein n=1 Tax=Streptomyces viridochromogenes Tue57 TaxID=1160705 RepID=L8PKN2_STRVR|nr:hypothetical protein [Streptomyces viridochromogenes]ELS56814.1 hypothetical protein STVIR_2190 [Streptomyces viridochromogenes Tue57]